MSIYIHIYLPYMLDISNLWYKYTKQVTSKYSCQSKDNRRKVIMQNKKIRKIKKKNKNVFGDILVISDTGPLWYHSVNMEKNTDKISKLSKNSHINILWFIYPTPPTAKMDLVNYQIKHVSATSKYRWKYGNNYLYYL